MDTIQVSNIKCTTGDSSMNPDSGRGPSSTTVTMCLRAWNGAGSGNAPLSLHHATGSRIMLNPDSHACAETIPSPRERHLKQTRRSKGCAVTTWRRLHEQEQNRNHIEITWDFIVQT